MSNPPSGQDRHANESDLPQERHGDFPEVRVGSDDLPPAEVLRGSDLFNNGAFFECHEELELAWRAEADSVRELYQGILQVGVGFYHQSRGNHHGAVTLLERGLRRLGRLPDLCRGVDVATLRAEATRCRDELVKLGPGRIDEFDRTLIPRIGLGRGK